MARTDDLTGMKFGLLTVTGRNDFDVQKRWFADCSCGNKVAVRKGDLVRGSTKSCGCVKAAGEYNKKRVTHGFAPKSGLLPTYRSWADMKSRCTNKNNQAYHRYGGRGIKICDEWINSFQCFLADMGEAPPGLTLDRIDFNGNYEKSNCRWISKADQAKNTRRNVFLEYNGERKILKDWAIEFNISAATLSNRIRDGWEVDRALTQKPKLGFRRIKRERDENGKFI